MKIIYMVAQDELLPDETTETRICFNFGAWTDENQATEKARLENEEYANGPEHDGDYYVIPISLRD